MPTKREFHSYSAWNSALLFFTCSLLIFTCSLPLEIKWEVVQIKRGLIRIKWEEVWIKGGLVARGCGCFAARGGKSGRKPWKCHPEIPKFPSRTAKSPKNLVQNFVKIFYSFGDGISRAAGYEFWKKLGRNACGATWIRKKSGKNSCGTTRIGKKLGRGACGTT